MIKKILSVLAAVGGVLSSIFFVLMKQAKEEQKTEHKENEDLKTNLEALNEAEKAVNKEKKENEELIKKAGSSNNLDAFNACNELLSK